MKLIMDKGFRDLYRFWISTGEAESANLLSILV